MYGPVCPTSRAKLRNPSERPFRRTKTSWISIPIRIIWLRRIALRNRPPQRRRKRLQMCRNVPCSSAVHHAARGIYAAERSARDGNAYDCRAADDAACADACRKRHARRQSAAYGYAYNNPYMNPYPNPYGYGNQEWVNGRPYRPFNPYQYVQEPTEEPIVTEAKTEEPPRLWNPLHLRRRPLRPKRKRKPRRL